MNLSNFEQNMISKNISELQKKILQQEKDMIMKNMTSVFESEVMMNFRKKLQEKIDMMLAKAELMSKTEFNATIDMTTIVPSIDHKHEGIVNYFDLLTIVFLIYFF